MLRAFILTTRKLLVPRPLPVYTLTSDATSSANIYDFRRRDRRDQPHRSILPLLSCPGSHALLMKNSLLTSDSIRWTSGKREFQLPDPSLLVCNMMNMLKCVDLAHMKDAPSPAFWFSMTLGGSQLIIPLLELIGGYSDTLTIFQLHLAAVAVGYYAGTKWGLAISKNPVPAPTWDTMKWVATPVFIAFLGLMLPYPLGFLTIAAAMVSSLYLDLKSCSFPPWANALRLFVALSTLVGLFLALSSYLLFHNRENQEKKEKEKKEEKKKKEEQGVEEEVVEEKPKEPKSR